MDALLLVTCMHIFYKIVWNGNWCINSENNNLKQCLSIPNFVRLNKFILKKKFETKFSSKIFQTLILKKKGMEKEKKKKKRRKSPICY